MCSQADKGDVQAVEELLRSGVDVNSHGDARWTALHRAAARGHCDVVRVLLAAGADPRLRTSQTQQTALHLCSQAGHTDVMRELMLSDKCDTTASDKNGWSPVSWAEHSSQHHISMQGVSERMARDMAKSGSHTPKDFGKRAETLAHGLKFGATSAGSAETRGSGSSIDYSALRTAPSISSELFAKSVRADQRSDSLRSLIFQQPTRTGQTPRGARSGRPMASPSARGTPRGTPRGSPRPSRLGRTGSAGPVSPRSMYSGPSSPKTAPWFL